MDLKDLAGISEPLNKLIDVVSKGLGRVTASYFAKKTVETRVLEINSITDAIVRNTGKTCAIEYHDGVATIKSTDEPLLSVYERANNRIEFTNTREQQNIEQITYVASQIIQAEKDVDPKLVDDDWIAHFFDYAKNIGNEDLQKIWSRILAGEVARPNSYSLRTLSVIKTLSVDEAKLITRASNCVFGFLDGIFMYKGREEDEQNVKDITFEDRLTLTELGILQPDVDISKYFNESKSGYTLFFESGGYLIKGNAKAGTAAFSIPVLRFTKVGTEIFNLIDPNPSRQVIESLGRKLLECGIDVEYVKLNRKLGPGNYEYQILPQDSWYIEK